MLLVVSTVAMVALCVGVAFAQEGEAEVHTKSWFDLFKSTGLVGILLVHETLEFGKALARKNHPARKTCKIAGNHAVHIR